MITEVDMGRPTPSSGHVARLVFVGVVLLVIPWGLTLAQGPVHAPAAVNATGTGTLTTPFPNLTVMSTATPTPAAGTATPPGQTPTPSSETPTPTPTPTSDAGGDERTIVVDDDGEQCDTSVSSITVAVSTADPGDTVVVCEGTYRESVTVETSNITISTEGNASLRSGLEVGFRITASRVTLQGFDIRTTDDAGIWIEGASRVTVRDNVVGYNGETGVANRQDQVDGIRLLGTSGTVVGNNTVSGFEDDSIEICCGKDNEVEEPGPSVNNRIVDNTLIGFPGYADHGILIGRQGNETVVRNNTILDHRSNTNDQPSSDQKGQGIEIVGNHTRVLQNTVTRTSGHLVNVLFQQHTEDIVIRNNVLRGSNNAGVHGVAYSMRILDNRITDNDIFGVYLDGASRFTSGEVEIHGNLILNNSMGIQNGNPFGTGSGDAPILNATNNIWDCGGPSSHLEDPYTHRVANGSGDPISAGDEPGVSNVHFDPFEVQDPASCPEQTPTPTPTTTPTSTPTATPTATSSSTVEEQPQPTSTTSDSSGAGGTGTNGGNEGEGVGDGGVIRGDSGDADTGGGIGDTTATPSSTPTPTPTVTPSVTPTPVVEPGFGVFVWIVGASILLGSVAGRRWSNRHGLA